ncbi:hypothetical protein FB464_3098 [Subtercola boreus]|nr:hypothetical protein [Subtercola boreus]TQL55530.1 hypothetical protein FB464_3098 [Subtercola boreus]
MTTCRAQQKRTWEEKGSSKGGRFLFFFRFAGSEWHAVHFTDLGKDVLEHYMGQFVGDVAVLAADRSQWIDDDDRPILDLEGSSGECEGLEALELFEVCDVNKVGGIDYSDTQVLCKLPWVEAIMWG